MPRTFRTMLRLCWRFELIWEMTASEGMARMPVTVAAPPAIESSSSRGVIPLAEDPKRTDAGAAPEAYARSEAAVSMTDLEVPKSGE